MKFKNGRKLSTETYEAIRWMPKVGVLTRETWYELFGRGKLRWQQAQLKYLIEQKIFKPHPCGVVQNIFVIDRKGAMMFKAKGWKYAINIYPQHVYHNESVALGIWKLEKLDICKKWITADELRSRRTEFYQLKIGTNKFKYPDAVMRVEIQGLLHVMAIEFETENQTYWRYRSLLKAYRGEPEFQKILFVTSDEGTRKSIQRVLNEIGDAMFKEKIVFVDTEIWKNNPQEVVMKIT